MGTIDVKEVFGKDTWTIVDRDAGAVEDAAEHVFRHRDAEIVPCELNCRLLNIDP